MSRAIDVQQMLQNEIELAHCNGPRAGQARARRLEQVAVQYAALQAAAHASLIAMSVAAQAIADDHLRTILGPYKPTDVDHSREDVDGLCVEESTDE